MASFNDVFKRKEVKYRLSASQYRFMRTVLAPYMQADAYGRSTIVSEYYDTPARELIERSLDKPTYKEKLRVRSYGLAPRDNRVYVELKKKFKGIVYKRRVGVSRQAARAWLAGMPYEQACAAYPLVKAEAQEECFTRKSLQIAAEITAFCQRNQGLVPSMLIACERVAYAMRDDAPVDAGALDCSEVRVTFDENIRYVDLFACGPDAPAVGILAPGEVIMEIKVPGAYPLWLVRMLSECKAYPTSFSKYGTAYKDACLHPFRNLPAIPA